MLTVARAAAEAAAAAAPATTTWPTVVTRGRRRRRAAALARTPEQLEVLRRAGVVDAGGRGVCVLLDALAAVVTGSAGEPIDVRGGRDAGDRAARPRRRAATDPDARRAGVRGDVPARRRRPTRSPRCAAALGRARRLAGRGRRRADVERPRARRRRRRRRRGRASRPGGRTGSGSPTSASGAPAARPGRPPAAAAAVVVASRPATGLAALFEAAGATVVRGGPAGAPSTGELLAGAARDPAPRRRGAAQRRRQPRRRRGRRRPGPRRGAAGRGDPDPGQRPGAGRARRARPRPPRSRTTWSR